MTTQILPKSYSLSKWLGKSESIDNICKSLLFSKFKELKRGHLVVEDRASGKTQVNSFGDEHSDLMAHLIVKRSCFYSRTLIGGSIGNGESFIDEDWEADDLTNIVRIFVLNREVLQKLDGGIGQILQPIQKTFHGLRQNSIKGSRDNIHAHYDIGNNFFQLFLDPTMMYSSAIFRNKEMTLEEASLLKIKTICDKLNLRSDDHLMEIGTGWGSLAIYAAQNYGCKVTTTTISEEQFKFTQERIKSLKLENQITLLFEDYRLLQGQYDKLVSVEMIEAVGLENLPTFFQKCSSLLKPQGIMVLQAITIRDQYYESAKSSVDFIQRHIFPGGGVPSVTAMMKAIHDKTDLILIDQKDHAEDYAETLLRWSQNLKANQEKIVELGYPDYLYRLWQYYFSYCEGGFRERAIGVSQMTFSKPLYRDRSFA